MNRDKGPPDRIVCAVLGAGDLIASLHRSPSLDNYHFQIARMKSTSRHVRTMRPEDLRDLIKICQVITFAVVDDGWISAPVRHDLLKLNEELDQLTRTWSKKRS